MRRRLAAFAALLLATGCVSPTGDPDQAAVDEPTRVANLRSYDEIWMRVAMTYLNPSPQQSMADEAQQVPRVNWQTIPPLFRRDVENAPIQGQARNAMKESLARLGMPHFALLPPGLKVADGQTALRGDLDDFGMRFQLQEDAPIVSRVEPGSPAAKAGVRPGWRLGAIDDLSLQDDYANLKPMMPPERLTTVRLFDHTLARMNPGAGKRVRLGFAIPTESGDRAERWVTLIGRPTADRQPTIAGEALDDRTLLLRCEAFLDPMRLLRTFDDLIATRPAAQNLIIDLRGNRGGLTSAATDLLGRLVDQRGKIGVMIRRDAAVPLEVEPHEPIFRGKIIVLVDVLTMSTAEIFARAIQDAHRGVVIGQPTPGAAQPTIVLTLANGDRMQYASADYVSSITGQRMEGVGVMPDQVVEPEAAAFSRGQDAQLEAARAWLAQP